MGRQGQGGGDPGAGGARRADHGAAARPTGARRRLAAGRPPTGSGGSGRCPASRCRWPNPAVRSRALVANTATLPLGAPPGLPRPGQPRPVRRRPPGRARATGRCRCGRTAGSRLRSRSVGHRRARAGRRAAQGRRGRTLVSAEEDQLSPLVGRVLQCGAKAAGATVELRVRRVDRRSTPPGCPTAASTSPWCGRWPGPSPAGPAGSATTASAGATSRRAKGLTTLAVAAERDPAAVARPRGEGQSRRPDAPALAAPGRPRRPGRRRPRRQLVVDRPVLGGRVLGATSAVTPDAVLLLGPALEGDRQSRHRDEEAEEQQRRRRDTTTLIHATRMARIGQGGVARATRQVA